MDAEMSTRACALVAQTLCRAHMSCVSSCGVRSSAIHTRGVSTVFCMRVGIGKRTHSFMCLRAVDALDIDRALVNVLALEDLLGEQHVRKCERRSIMVCKALDGTHDLLPIL